MNDDSQLTIFEPFKEPRTVILKNVNEDSIVDENGRPVNNYRILYDEAQSPVKVSPEKILSYIENWESQNGAQASKAEKRKRKKERNKQKKAEMKSSLHCDENKNALTPSNHVEIERAFLKSMKEQNQSISSLLNVKRNRNRFINCNTNVRPFENSIIQPGCKKTNIDVVNLDSEEDSNSDDDVLINIDPPPQIQRRNRVTDFSVDRTYRNQNSFVANNSNRRNRRSKYIEIVQIMDSSSDSDVECIPCEEVIESISDDDDDLADSSSKKLEDSTSVPIDEKAMEELADLADSFVAKYFSNSMPPLAEPSSQTNADPAAPHFVITEPVSLQPTSALLPVSEETVKTATKTATTEQGSVRRSPSPVKSKKKTKTVPESTTEPNDSLSSTKTKKNQKKRVAFNNMANDREQNADDLVIIVHEPPGNESLESDIENESLEVDPGNESSEENPVNESGKNNLQADETSSEDSNGIETVSEDDDDHPANIVEYDSIPSPDYTPNVSIPVTASYMKAFAEFVRSQQNQNSVEKDESEDDNDSVKVEELTDVTAEPTSKPHNQSQTSSQHGTSPSKPQPRPWLKRNRKPEEIVQAEHVTTRNRPTQPWLHRRSDESDEIQVIEPPPVVCNSRETVEKVDFDKQRETNDRNSSANQKQLKRPYQKSESTPQVAHSASSSRPQKFTNAYKNNNTCVEFFDKNHIRIGITEDESESGCCQAKRPILERDIQHVNNAGKSCAGNFPNSGRYRESQDDSQRNSLNQRPFYPPVNRQCNTVSEYQEEEPWPLNSDPETEVRNKRESECDNCCEPKPHESQQQSETSHKQSHFPASTIVPVERNRYHPEPYDEDKYCPQVYNNRFQRNSGQRFTRNRYHPEPFEEEKYNPTPAPPNCGQQRQMVWRHQNQDNRPYHQNRYRNDNQYRNRPWHKRDNFNQGGYSQNRFGSNQGHQRFYSNQSQNGPRYGQQNENQRSYSYYDRPKQFGENKQYSNQSHNTSYSSSSDDTRTRNPPPANEEVLFTRRRDKFEYKANVSHFDDFNHQQPPPPSLKHTAHHSDKNGNSCQENDVENYESNVVQKLKTSTSDENAFSWENNRSCDFVPFNANQPISSPPWILRDSPEPEKNPQIQAISRQPWLNKVLNARF